MSAENDQITLQGDEQEIEAEGSRNRNITSTDNSLPSVAETSTCSDWVEEEMQQQGPGVERENVQEEVEEGRRVKTTVQGDKQESERGGREPFKHLFSDFSAFCF